MAQPRGGFKKEGRRITIRTTDGSTLSGYVNIGLRERVSDLFTKAENQFIVLFDAEQKGSAEEKVFFVNKQQIVWAEPVDETQ